MEDDRLTASLLNDRGPRMTPLQKYPKIRVILKGLNIFLSGGLLGVVQYTVFDSEETCQFPIKEWLNLYSAYLAFSILVDVAVESVLLCCRQKANCIWKTWTLIMQIACFLGCVWVAVGSYWFFANPGCEDDFAEGYKLMLILLIIYYVFYGLICCVISVLCFLGLIFSGFLSVET